MAQERSEAHSKRPYFFLSYAHTPRLDPYDAPDPDMWVHRLFRDLCEHVMYMTVTPAGAPIGFMDRETRAGEIWSNQTSEALATCRVFVPMYSPRYFISDTCGREWSAFSQRQAQHSRSSPPGLPAIVPALWTPVPSHNLPPAARSLQYDHERFGREYATFGLYGLIKLRSYRRQYEETTYRLAQTIVATAAQNPLPAGHPLDFTQLPSAFEQRTGLRRIRIVVAAPSREELPPGRPERCYGPSALDWNPYRESDTDTTRPLAEIAATIAERLDYRATVESLDEVAGGLLAGRRPDGPTLMLLDKLVLSDPKRQALLTKVDEAELPWLGVVVPSNPSDPDDETGLELQTALERRLPRTVRRVRSVPRAAMAGVPTLADFVALLPHVIQWAAAQFLRFTPSHPPPGSAPPRFRLGGPVEEASDDRRP